MTLNNRAATAAPAIVQRIMMRRRALVLLLVLPRNKGCNVLTLSILAERAWQSSRKSLGGPRSRGEREIHGV